MSVRFALFETAIGRSAIAWGDNGIVAVQLPQRDEAQTRLRLAQRFADAVECSPPDDVVRAIDGIARLTRGESVDFTEVTLDLSNSPPFNSVVYAIARTIPFGKTLTYGDIAKRVGSVLQARAVGQALGENPCPIIVPCHRVLAAGDKPGGFSAHGGVVTKLKLLDIEGAIVNYTPSLFD